MNKSKKSRATTTATGLSALASSYYDKKFIDTLKTQTPFMQWLVCACGQEGVVCEVGTLPVCEGCKFRLTVMKAAGRETEFWADYKAKRENRLDAGEPIDILTRRPLPVSSGKTIQMFQYESVAKP